MSDAIYTTSFNEQRQTIVVKMKERNVCDVLNRPLEREYKHCIKWIDVGRYYHVEYVDPEIDVYDCDYQSNIASIISDFTRDVVERITLTKDGVEIQGNFNVVVTYQQSATHFVWEFEKKSFIIDQKTWKITSEYDENFFEPLSYSVETAWKINDTKKFAKLIYEVAPLITKIWIEQALNVSVYVAEKTTNAERRASAQKVIELLNKLI